MLFKSQKAGEKSGPKDAKAAIAIAIEAKRKAKSGQSALDGIKRATARK